MDDVTRIEPRKEWYERGDYIQMIADEGQKNAPAIRKAQLKVAEIEFSNAMLMLKGEDETGHKWQSAPYLWKVCLVDTNEDPDPITNDEKHIRIAYCGGGDSFGFGYEWYYDSKDNTVYMTEDPKGSRQDVG